VIRSGLVAVELVVVEDVLVIAKDIDRLYVPTSPLMVESRTQTPIWYELPASLGVHVSVASELHSRITTQAVPLNNHHLN
jgi:hypothetical protein